jgi:hypothetical protein
VFDPLTDDKPIALIAVNASAFLIISVLLIWPLCFFSLENVAWMLGTGDTLDKLEISIPVIDTFDH